MTGTDNSVGHVDDADSTTDSDKATITAGPKSDATNAAKSIITQDPTTVVVTAPGQNQAVATSSISPTAKPSNGGGSKAGIAAGVVIGVVALCVFVGGLFFYLRNRKRRAVENEYQQNAGNGNALGTGTLSRANMSDSRLEPSVMMQRRQSDGSIADNQDYSRRILKVRPSPQDTDPRKADGA